MDAKNLTFYGRSTIVLQKFYVRSTHVEQP